MAWSQQDVIEHCVAEYGRCARAAYKVSRYPDTEPDARNRPEIDAYAEAPLSPSLAIEHTRIESFAAQLEDSARIDTVCSGLEEHLRTRGARGFALVFPLYAFAKGFSWKASRELIIDHVLSTPGPGVHDIPGVPFPITLLARPPFYDVSIARFAPTTTKLEADLAASIAKALHHKRQALQGYRASGARTLLIVESSDIALVNPQAAYVAFLLAQETALTDHLTDLWLAFTYDPRRMYWYAFLGESHVLSCVNGHYRFGPQYADDWHRQKTQE